MTARLGRPVRMTARKATDGSNFSYKEERSALYDLAGEKRVEIVAGDFEGGDCRSSRPRLDCSRK